MPQPTSKSTGPRWTPEQVEACASALRRGFAALRCEEPLTLWEWADSHFYMPPESSNIEGPWETLPYQRAIMGAVSNDDLASVTLQKAKRIGWTKILTAAVGYFAAHLRRSGVVYQPTEGDSEDYVTEHADPLLRDVTPVRAALLANPEKKSRHNKKDQKAFAGALWHFRGGKSGRAYRSLTKDVVIYDELSGFDHDIDGEGSPVSLGDGRIEGSPYPKSLRGSTPKIRGLCHIEKSVSDADLTFWRFLRCLACGELHRLEWRYMVFDSNDLRDTHHACPHCGHMAEYGELRDMDAGGEWRTLLEQNQPDGDTLAVPGNRRIDDYGVVTDVETKARVDVEHVAFRIWSAYSWFRPWLSIAREFLAAKRKADAGDVAALKSWTNTVLGETWEETALEADTSDLVRRREHYTADTMPAGVQLLTAGVDVQGDRIEACVYGWGYGEESWHAEAVRLYGDPTQPALWAELDAWLLQPRHTVDGRALKVRATGVDTGQATDAAYRFCAPRWGRRIMAMKGRATEKDRPIVTLPTTPRKPKAGEPRSARCRLFTVGVHNAKTLLLNRLRLPAPGPGYCHLPMTLDAEFCEQLAAEKLVSRMVRGREVKEFVEMRARNEALDMLVYGYAALCVLDPTWLRGAAPPAAPAPLRSPGNGSGEAAVTEAPAAPADPVPRRRQQRRRRGNWVTTW